MFAIGDAEWPGISKVMEEAGEVVQVCGKLVGTHGAVKHFDGSDLQSRLEGELGDLLAAIDFLIDHNPRLDKDIIAIQHSVKRKVFEEYHRKQAEKQTP